MERLYAMLSILSTLCVSAIILTMTPKQAIDYFGSQSRMASGLNVSIQMVHNWKRRGQIPLGWQIYLESYSNGQLKLDRKRPMRRNGS